MIIKVYIESDLLLIMVIYKDVAISDLHGHWTVMCIAILEYCFSATLQISYLVVFWCSTSQSHAFFILFFINEFLFLMLKKKPIGCALNTFIAGLDILIL